MFNHRETYQQLESYKIKDWAQQCEFAARSLPRKLKKIALDLLPGWQYGHTRAIRKANHKYGQALEALNTLSSSDRQRVFAVFFPKISQYLEGGWALHDRIPYQQGYLRKPFREGDVFALMHRHIGVRFEYEDSPRLQENQEQGHTEEQITQALAALPSEWLQTLERATRHADLLLISSVLEQIRRREPSLGELLASFADGFEYDEILRLLQTPDQVITS